jgi:hypothetical protein
MTPVIQVIVAIVTLISLALSGLNAWTRVKQDLAVANLRADVEKKFNEHFLKHSADALDFERRFVSKADLDRLLENFGKLLNKLGGQVRELERIIDRRGDETHPKADVHG